MKKVCLRKMMCVMSDIGLDMHSFISNPATNHSITVTISQKRKMRLKQGHVGTVFAKDTLINHEGKSEVGRSDSITVPT